MVYFAQATFYELTPGGIVADEPVVPEKDRRAVAWAKANAHSFLNSHDPVVRLDGSRLFMQHGEGLCYTLRTTLGAEPRIIAHMRIDDHGNLVVTKVGP